MSDEEKETLRLIQGAISELPAAQYEACLALAEHIRRMLVVAAEPVGPLAVALIGAELQLKNAKD
jgi:hypothetical protein